MAIPPSTSPLPSEKKPNINTNGVVVPRLVTKSQTNNTDHQVTTTTTTDSLPRAKTCHQCRQMKMNNIAVCKNVQNGKRKPCCLRFCGNCLRNRYGEEVAHIQAWTCPRCRGICNCSHCMRKNGHQPTGLLIQTAKAQGFSSVSHLLHSRGINLTTTTPVKLANRSLSFTITPKEKEAKLDNKQLLRQDNQLNLKRKATSDETDNNENFSAKVKTKSPIKKVKQASGKPTESNAIQICGGGVDVHVNRLQGSVQKLPQQHAQTNAIKACDAGANKETEPLQNALKPRKCVKKTITESTDAYMVLPQGTSLKTVGVIELIDQDVGPALQFMEFCAAFAKVLDIRKGQAESILGELSRGLGRRGLNSTLVQFHIKLLSLILKDKGKSSQMGKGKNVNSWLKALEQCVADSQHQLKDVPLDFIGKGLHGYDELEASKKLTILNFLCDEVLCTGRIRSWIDKEHAKYLQRRREENIRVGQEQQKNSEAQVTHSLSLKNGALLAVQKNDTKASEIKRKQRSDVLRTESISVDGLGRAFWKLKGYCDNSSILLQVVAKRDVITTLDGWFLYDDEEEKIVEKHISFVKKIRSRRPRAQ